MLYAPGQDIEEKPDDEILDTENLSKILEQIGSSIVKVYKNESECFFEILCNSKNFCRPLVKKQFRKN